jgi:hypothetical protein
MYPLKYELLKSKFYPVHWSPNDYIHFLVSLNFYIVVSCKKCVCGVCVCVCDVCCYVNMFPLFPSNKDDSNIFKSQLNAQYTNYYFLNSNSSNMYTVHLVGCLVLVIYQSTEWIIWRRHWSCLWTGALFLIYVYIYKFYGYFILCLHKPFSAYHNWIYLCGMFGACTSWYLHKITGSIRRDLSGCWLSKAQGDDVYKAMYFRPVSSRPS